tara:strand:- start:477 stop:878 length:402 start_codon:yes stop_codon:yes gene_type:complete
MKTALGKSKKKIEHTRLETWAMPGVPDVVLCDESGGFHFVELKSTANNAVDLRPHQVSWLSRHKHASTWILVLRIADRGTRTKAPTPESILLYRGSDAMDLKFDGLKVDPVYCSDGKADWDTILDLIVSRETL